MQGRARSGAAQARPEQGGRRLRIGVANHQRPATRRGGVQGIDGGRNRCARYTPRWRVHDRRTLPAAEVPVPDRCEQLSDFWWPNILARLRPFVNRPERAVIPRLRVAQGQQDPGLRPQLGELLPLPTAWPVHAGLELAQLIAPVDPCSGPMLVPQRRQLRTRPDILHLETRAEAEQLQRRSGRSRPGPSPARTDDSHDDSVPELTPGSQHSGAPSFFPASGRVIGRP